MTSMKLNRGVPLTLAVVGVLTLHGAGFGAELSAKEEKGTSLSSTWRSARGLITRGSDGKIIFLFGETQPAVVCSPLQVCDIELQEGETVRDVMVGDTVRWKVVPASSGPDAHQAFHLIVKPAEPGLSTSMVVTTSRRTYHIELKSHPIEYMARVGFDYPDDIATRLTDINQRIGENAADPGPNVERLSFGYTLSGSASWRPKRVYGDGEKTYIQFPRSLSGTDAPVLFVVSGGENRIVNYRLKNGLMIVDYNIKSAILVSGVGWHQQKVTIRRGG